MWQHQSDYTNNISSCTMDIHCYVSNMYLLIVYLPNQVFCTSSTDGYKKQYNMWDILMASWACVAKGAIRISKSIAKYFPYKESETWSHIWIACDPLISKQKVLDCTANDCLMFWFMNHVNCSPVCFKKWIVCINHLIHKENNALTGSSHEALNTCSAIWLLCTHTDNR